MRSSTRRGHAPKAFAASLVALSLLAAACGSDKKSSSSTAATTTVPAATTPATSGATTTPASSASTPDTATAGSGSTAGTSGSTVTSDGTATGGTSVAPVVGKLPAGEYKIGYSGPSTGPAAVAGIPLLDGVKFAVQQINDTKFLGDGVTLKLVDQDDGGDAAKAISAYDSITSEGVSGVICCGLSSQAGALKPKIVAGDIPAVISSAILPGLPVKPNLYRPVLLLADPAYDQLIAAYVKANPNVKTAVLGVTGDSDGMVADGDVWKAALKAHGIDLIDTVSTNTGDTDFSGPATQVIDKNPDLFIANMLSAEATLMIKTLRERGFKNKIMSTYGLSSAGNFKVGGASLDGVVFPQAFAPQSTVPAAQALIKDYKAATGKDADVYVAQGYNAVYFLATGMKIAQSGKPADVAKGLASITKMDTVYGPVTFDDTGQAHLVGTAVFLQWNADGSQSLWDPTKG